PRHEHKDGLQPLHRACAGPHKRHAKTVQVLLSSGKVKFNDATSTGLNCELLTRNPDILTLIAPQAMAQAKVAERRRAERAAAALQAELEAMDDDSDVEDETSRTVIRNAGEPQVDEDGRVVVSAAETHVDVDWDREGEDAEADDDEDDDDYDLVDAEI
ncbi:Ankyrin Repeat, partial [Perkinsus olseni]